MVRDATAEKNKQRMTAVTGRGSCVARATNTLAFAIFLVAAVTVDTSAALPTWRRLGFRTGSGWFRVPGLRNHRGSLNRPEPTTPSPPLVPPALEARGQAEVLAEVVDEPV